MRECPINSKELLSLINPEFRFPDFFYIFKKTLFIQMKIPLYIVTLSLFFLFSCTDPEKEAQLQQREQELQQREKLMASQMEELEDLRALRDSLETAQDSVAALPQVPEFILGKWNGKMICTESNCSEHVIGDQRSDSWYFTADSVKITNKTGGERSFIASYSDSEIRLMPKKDAIGTGRSEITLQINPENPERLKGSREVAGKECTAKFSVELEKNKK